LLKLATFPTVVVAGIAEGEVIWTTYGAVPPIIVAVTLLVKFGHVTDEATKVISVGGVGCTNVIEDVVIVQLLASLL